MTETQDNGLRTHEDTALFREALNFTAAQTRFTAQMIEKDYFCTVVLGYLATTAGESCIFKGGTCLAKVHVGFYRMSEDLDFAIPMPLNATRKTRSKQMQRLKQTVASIPDNLVGLNGPAALQGVSDSMQYIGTISYVSTISGQEETIKLEISLREPLITPLINAHARIMLLDPLSGEPLVADIVVPCISKAESFAEKFRAATTRREVAIRDFYDLDHAARKQVIDLTDARFVELIRSKLAVPANDALDLTASRLAKLRTQLEPRLRPVLRQEDYDCFDLDRAFAKIVEVANLLG